MSIRSVRYIVLVNSMCYLEGAYVALGRFVEEGDPGEAYKIRVPFVAAYTINGHFEAYQLPHENTTDGSDGFIIGEESRLLNEIQGAVNAYLLDNHPLTAALFNL